MISTPCWWLVPGCFPLQSSILLNTVAVPSPGDPSSAVPLSPLPCRRGQGLHHLAGALQQSQHPQ